LVQNRIDWSFPMSSLNNGAAFPTLESPAVGGGVISLPGDLSGAFGVVLIYRGAWCPVCNHQFADFGAKQAALQALGVKMVALSVDDEANAKAFKEKHGLAFAVGHSADADKVAAATGAYTNDAPRFLQPTGYVLAPDGSVMSAVYATNAVGRLSADEVIGFVEYVKSKISGQNEAAA
jgi:peroxiredoxin